MLADLAAEPMARMSQAELAKRLGLERTQALRLFKDSTGTTFRQFKRWTGLQHAARLIVAGALVRTAAMDAGFADTAHLTRTFKQCFGLTPSQAIAGLPTIGGGDCHGVTGKIPSAFSDGGRSSNLVQIHRHSPSLPLDRPRRLAT